MALGLKYSGGSVKFFAAYLKNGNIVNLFSSANTPQINTDYCLEIKASVSSSSGSVESWVDGVKDDGLSDASGFDNDDGGNINYAFVGCDNYVEESYPLTVWVDDVVVADSYVGPLASKLVYTAGGGQTLTSGSVSSVITVQVQDADGNPVTTGATVNLSTTSNEGTFYSDSGGNNQINAIVIS
jgi:hypothetical protein